MRNQRVIFTGLFLIVFALFANQLKKKPVLVVQSTLPSAAEEVPVSTPAPKSRIHILYDKVARGEAFANPLDELQLLPARARLGQDFTIRFAGDEIYSDASVNISETWNNVLDFLAKVIVEEPGVKVEISGYADLSSKRERLSTDYGSSDLAFSFSRAEWLAHYFERKHRIQIEKTFVLRGMGAIPKGKRIDLRFFYGNNDSTSDSGKD